MPARPPSPCTYPGCTQYAAKGGRCDAHQVMQQRPAWDHKGKSARDRGYGRQWEAIRHRVMVRDGWLCQECKRHGRLRTANECDHIVPKARGGTDDPDNLQALCRACHKAKTQTERGISRHKIRPPACPVVLICGPPGAGKTTYARTHAGPSDIVIDLDATLERLSGQSRATLDRGRWLRSALGVRNLEIDQLAEVTGCTAYVIMGLPRKSDREWWALKLCADVVVLGTDPYDCIKRIEADALRSPADRASARDHVLSWYKKFTL